MSIEQYLCILSFMFLLYTWFFYPLTLGFVSFFMRSAPYVKGYFPSVSVVIAAHNEAKNIQARIDNIFSSEYPRDKLQVIVVSDGSSDGTVEISKRCAGVGHNIAVLDIQPQGGRANAHNLAISACTGDVVVFTDAETRFSSDFLKKITAPFFCDKVGFASGVLKYINQTSNNFTSSAGFYWRFEMWIRRFESKLGVFAFGSGACCAVRKELFKTLPVTGDVDFTTPLDVVLQGYRCIHVEDAVAEDLMPHNAKQEFRARVRMTAKNFSGTMSRWGVSGYLFHPVYTLVIWSHKIFRWMTPVFMLVLFVSSIFGFANGSNWVLFLLVIQIIFYMLAILGWRSTKWWVSTAAYSFVLVNIAFLFGILRAVLNNVPSYYRPLSQS